MADIKLKSVDKNKIGEYIGECRSVMGGAKLYLGCYRYSFLCSTYSS